MKNLLLESFFVCFVAHPKQVEIADFSNLLLLERATYLHLTMDGGDLARQHTPD